MIGIARRRILLPTEDFVDLGLPSGLLWAKCNVGTTTEAGYGLYFSWGETTGYVDASSKTNRGATGFTWGSYEHITGTSGAESALTKYNSTDGKTVLDLEDDAAHVIMGGNWRMPTSEEFNEMALRTTKTWVTNYNGTGINGNLFTSKTDPNKKLFFPATGQCFNNTTAYNSKSNGYYLSSGLDTSDRLRCKLSFFNSGNTGIGFGNRCYGYSIRPVFDTQMN